MKRSAIFLSVSGLGVFLASAIEPVDLPVTTNLILRLDGTDVTLNAGAVSAWNNQVSGTDVSADFIQASGGSQPAYVANALNGRAVLEFDGSDDHLYDLADSAWDWDFDSNSNNAARWTTFFVSKPDVTTGNRFLLRCAYSDYREGSSVVANTALWGVWYDDNIYSVHCRNSAGSWVAASLAGVDTQWHIFGGRIQNLADPSITFFLDNQVKATTLTDTTRQMSGHIRTRIGASTSNDTANELFDGQLAEVLVYKEILTPWEIAEVNGYLALKYGFAASLDEGLMLYCRMDDAQVERDGVHPPPALSTDDGQWTVVDVIRPAENGVAKVSNTSGSVTSGAEGVIGEAIRFSDSTGGDRRVDFGLSEALQPGTNSFTVSVWFKPTGVGGIQFVASHGNNGSLDGGWSIWLDGTLLRLRCNAGSVNANANKAQFSWSGLQNDVWYHAVLVLDRSTNKLLGYLNGSRENLFADANWGDSFTSDPIDSAGLELLLGARNDEQMEFKGMVDDFALWGRALTAGEIAAIYTLGRDGQTFAAIPPPEGTIILIQ